MHPELELEVIGLQDRVTLQAMVDTGFSGFLCMPSKFAIKLGLVLSGQERYELANGQWVTQLIFKGQVRFLGQLQDIEILVGDSETSTIGVLLMAECLLTIDYPANKVKLTRKKT